MVKCVRLQSSLLGVVKRDDGEGRFYEELPASKTRDVCEYKTCGGLKFGIASAGKRTHL